MAQVGFPWNDQSRPREPAQTSEKDTRLAVPENKPQSILIDTTNQRQPRTNGSIKRRSDTVKTNAIARQNIRFQSEPERPRESIKRIPVRTIPPWIQDADEDDLAEAGLLLPENPNAAFVAQHNHSPSTTQRPLLGAGSEAQGRKRPGGYPLSSGRTRSEPTSRWVSFARASAYPRENFHSEKVDAKWLNENFTDYSKPWLADHNDDDVEDGSDKYRAFRRKRRVWYKRVHYAVMRNPFVPLFFRLFVILFAAIAMALGASIHHENNVIVRCIQQPMQSRSSYCASRVGQQDVNYDRDPSALMAIIVDAVAIIYTVYITYDEYFSKPLGLRPPSAKVRLVLLDLFFIVFQSANLSLAFNSLTIEAGACRAGERDATQYKFENICDRAQALSGVLFISLIAWLLTFSVSVLRLVERINAR